MRPRPIERVAGAPPFVLGLAIVRGVPLVVVDARVLVGAAVSEPKRFVTIRVDERSVVLAVDGVEGVVEMDAADAMSPLVDSPMIDAIARLDDRLLMVLRTARIVEIEAA